MMDLYVWITYLLICHKDQQNSGKYTIHTMDPSWRCFLGLNFLGEFRFESHRSPSALQQRLPARWLQPLHRSLQCDWRPEGGKCSGLDFQRRGWSEANVTSDLFGEKTVKKKHIHTQSPRNLLESCDIRKKIYICYGFGKLCLRSLQPLLGIWWVSRSLGFLNTIYLVMSQPSYKTHVKDFTSPKQRDSCRNHYRSLIHPIYAPIAWNISSTFGIHVYMVIAGKSSIQGAFGHGTNFVCWTNDFFLPISFISTHLRHPVIFWFSTHNV